MNLRNLSTSNWVLCPFSTNVQRWHVKERWWGSSWSATTPWEHARPPARFHAWIVLDPARLQRPLVFAVASPRAEEGRWSSAAPTAPRTPRRWKQPWNVAAPSVRCNSTVVCLFVLQHPLLPFCEFYSSRGCRSEIFPRWWAPPLCDFFFFFTRSVWEKRQTKTKMGHMCVFFDREKYIVRYKWEKHRTYFYYGFFFLKDDKRTDELLF